MWLGGLMWVGGLLGVGGGKGYVGTPLKLFAPPPPSYAYEASEQQNNGHQT